jgi:hypothetical protein
MYIFFLFFNFERTNFLKFYFSKKPKIKGAFFFLSRKIFTPFLGAKTDGFLNPVVGLFPLLDKYPTIGGLIKR